MSLAVAGRHIYAKWHGKTCFNIEASNPAGMTVPSDDELRKLIKKGKLAPDTEKSGYFLRTLLPCEEFALFMTCRVECLIDMGRYEETLLWSARALQFAPDDPYFPHIAHHALDLALKHRFRRVHPDQKIPSANVPFSCNVGDLLRIEERSLYLTIVAHYMEATGEVNEARQLYEDACRQNFHGNNEQRDLQRFLKKHQLPSRNSLLMRPKNLGQPQRIKLFCKPWEEAEALRQLADQFERKGELVKARDALYDLYMFDPSDAELFQRARAFSERPQFQEQLKAIIEHRGHEYERSKVLGKQKIVPKQRKSR